MRFTKEAYYRMGRKRLHAFQQIAQKLGKEHPITKMMGSRAWGRHEFESGAEAGLQDYIREMSALDGAFDILDLWARDNDPKAQRVMLDIYPMRFEP